MAEARREARCAIYTRKSTEHNLDLEFNSLDAQREACEAYIKSQAHEGWQLVPAHFDDGGLSGASLARPALRELLSQIQAGKIDIVVVYKVDRLTRSLTDFAKLVDLFDRHNVSFVSITQAFNTTTSMGRLTLNVLLSFAQFEREVIGERVRDKIAASKKKGLWMGGPVPLGYAAKNKKLVIVDDEAETVRLIFRRYLELDSIQALAADLNKRGIRTKRRMWANDKVIGGVPFGVGPLAYLLKNRMYVGEIVHRGQISRGDHAPIIDRELFDAVQHKLNDGAVERKLKIKASPNMLAGKIYDDRGNGMTPSHTVKKGVRYRYYVSQAVLQRRPQEAGSVARAPAAEIETLVSSAVHQRENDGRFSTQVERVVLKQGLIEVHFGAAAAQPEVNSAEDVVVMRWTPTNTTAFKGVARRSEPGDRDSVKNREVILTAIGNARRWLDELMNDQITIAGIAEQENKGERYIRLLLPLAFLPPKAVEGIVNRRTAANVTLIELTKASISWVQ